MRDINMDTENVTILGWVLVLFMILGLFSYLIIQTIRAHKLQKKYLPNMKVGDSVWFSTPATDIDGIVEKIDGDFVKVSLIVRKDRLHSNQKPGE